MFKDPNFKAAAKAHAKMDGALSDIEDATELLVKFGYADPEEGGTPPTPAELSFLYRKLKQETALLRRHWDETNYALVLMAIEEERAEREEQPPEQPRPTHRSLTLVKDDGSAA